MLPVIEINPEKPADCSMIWLHGLGADGNDFVGIVEQLDLPRNRNIRFVFPHAPMQPVTINGGHIMRAWYDIDSLEFVNREDEQGIRASAEAVTELIENEVNRGISSRNILLAGFSQGGAIALHLGLRHPEPLGGILALSTYLPVADKVNKEKSPAQADMPIMMAHGSVDDVIPVQLARQSSETLISMGFDLQWHQYAMSHMVCPEEIRDISAWISTLIGHGPQQHGR
ncbi:MAG: alpha/beta hydrolase [Gammaproteobacteria bacterium]